jgi:hypothetical protein
MIGTHTVYVYPDRSDDPSGPFVDVSCLIDEVALIHGRADAQSQPVASSATINLTVGPGAPLPAEVEIGAWVVIATTVGATTSTRFVGRISDMAIGWDDAGEDTPDNGIGQIVAVGPLADLARRVVGDEPFPKELDGARVARVLSLAGIDLDPGTSDPGICQVIPRDVDARAALDVAQGTANSAGGLLWSMRSGEIRYADAEHRRGITVAQDLDSCDLLVTPTWLRSLAGLVNDVRMTYGVTDTEAGTEQATYHGVNETSKTKFGRYEYSTTVELADAVDAVAATNLILTLNGAPVWMLQELPIDVAGLPAADTSTILGLEVHTLIRVNGFPVTGSTPTAVVAWVEGWTERLAFGVHDLTMIVSDYCRTVPPPRWNDVPTTQTWDTTDPGMTWDKSACWGPPVYTGLWDSVPASLRWDQVDPATRWDDVASGIPTTRRGERRALVPA